MMWAQSGHKTMAQKLTELKGLLSNGWRRMMGVEPTGDRLSTSPDQF